MGNKQEFSLDTKEIDRGHVETLVISDKGYDSRFEKMKENYSMETLTPNGHYFVLLFGRACEIISPVNFQSLATM